MNIPDSFKIFDEKNLIELNEILKLPNDNYTCSENKCELIPEIINIDYGNGIIEFNCKVHGNKSMFLKDYLKKMSKNTYIYKTCSFCDEIQKNSTDFIFDYCLFCQKYICKKCRSKHRHSQILKVNDLDNKCLKHHNKLYEYFCVGCKKNFCNLCNDHQKHKEKISSSEFLATKEVKMLQQYNDLFKKAIEIIPYLIKINELLITCQSKYPFNYFHNNNLKNASHSFIKTDLFLREVNYYKENNLIFASAMSKPISQSINIIKSTVKEIEEQKKLLEEFNTLYNTSLDGDEIIIELNNKNIGNSGVELLSKIKFPNAEIIKLKNNNISKIEPIEKLCSRKKTRKLDFSINKIENISVLKNENFQGINSLNLRNNLIEDISVFGIKDIFPQLEKLDISNNRINLELDNVEKTIKELEEKLSIFKYKNDNNNYYIITNYSSVLTKNEDIEFLNQRFKLKNPKVSTINYHLLYRGRRDGDRARDFHNKVDGINNTLCVIKTPKGLFGGYTEATWDGENCDKFDNNAFCFSLYLKKIYELKEGADAIGCNKEYGPIFRFTFLLNDQYFKKNGFCYPKTPHFNVEENKFELSGGEKYPEIIECEVYQIIYE